MTDIYTLYGMPASLYTSKVRSYLRKNHIPFIEHGANHPHFQQNIVPKVGRMIMPVLETPSGEVLQDGADIIDYFEQAGISSLPALPQNSVLKTISYLFELFGGEGLLRPAMHYRWNFDQQQLGFIKEDFVNSLLPPSTDEETADGFFDFVSGKMRGAASIFGVTEESIPLIETSYKEFLQLFSDHVKTHPFLLGGSPTIGDYGLIAPLYAHLARDPVPAMLMRQQFPKVSRWVERMRSPEQIVVDYLDSSQALIEPDKVPNTLKAMMRYVTEEYLPELQAHVEYANQWLANRPELKAGTNGLDDPSERVIGLAKFEWRGINLETAVMPYRFYLLQRIQDCFEQANETDQQAINALFEETGLASVLTSKTTRRVQRVNHLEVWGD